MPNRLIHEKSPYLLQHAHNPVDWFPWGPEAFDQAKRLDKPVFLSVGYATCHWCHVMEKESFEDPQAAAALNDSFVCIKVDREERPDIDAVYMAACQMVSGQGGWPLSILMTPDKKPFFAGTYIPKIGGFGRIGLIDLCKSVDRLWRENPQRVLETADSLTGHLNSAFAFDPDPNAQVDKGLLDQAVEQITARYDADYGGFEKAPKFPMPHRLLFLLRAYERTGNARLLEMVEKTLMAMRLGGLWDHVGFGFHRYSTDRQWLLPHFEKMLYDQALLTEAYTKAYEISGKPLFGRTAREILTYVLRDMTDPDGGFYTAQDADSEGEEGKFYVWPQADFERILGDHLKRVPWTRILNLQPGGNFVDEASRRKTGTNILYMNQPLDHWARQLDISSEEMERSWQTVRELLTKERIKRPAPLKDDKILTDWNGMMIASMARAARILKEDQFADSAGAAADFVLNCLVNGQGALLHRYRNGESAIAATANDYAFFISGLIELHRTTADSQWIGRALELQQQMNSRFWDPEQGGFYLTAEADGELPVRPKEIYDGAIPSYNAVALINLVQLSRLSGETRWDEQVQRTIRAFAGSVRRMPSAFTHTLNGWDLVLRDAI